MVSDAPAAAVHLEQRQLFAGRLAYGLLLVICLGMFVTALYGKATQGAFGDCAALYVEPEWEHACADWRTAFEDVGLTPAAFEIYFLIVRVAAAVPYLVLSLLLMHRHGEQLRVLLLASLLLLMGTGGTFYNPFWAWSQSWFTVENQVPLLNFLSRLLNLLLSVGLVLFAFLFPDGRFVPRWGPWAVGLWLYIRFGDEFFPDTPISVYTWPLNLGLILNTAIILVAAAAVVWRYRTRATAEQRQQIKWITFGGLLLVFSYLLDYGVWELYPFLTGQLLIATEQQGIWWELGQDTLWYVSQFIFAICVGLAVFRNRLWDIDLVLSRTLVYGALTVLIISLYIAIVGGLGALFHTQTTAINGLLATGVIAVLFQPLRERLQRAVNRLLYGQRDDPTAVLTQLAHQLETADAQTQILPNLAQTIANTLKIPHVAIRLPADAGQASPAAVWGSTVEPVEVMPLIYQNQAVGSLIVGLRGPSEQFNPHERKLLGTIAALTASTVQAVQTSEALQQSRRRIVTAREEERRRLRRDLHDGVGPALASLPLKIDAAIDLIDQQDRSAADLLGSVKRQAQELVADVRRVVHDLRPPALDELGLVEALRGSVTQLGGHPQAPAIDFAADGRFDEVSAAAEAAAYRITLEAVNNIIRHARAAHCWVRLAYLEQPPCLEIQIEDDGIGLPQPLTPNVGLRSMRERAEELGGEFHLQSRSLGGTRVTVRLPLSSVSPLP